MFPQPASINHNNNNNTIGNLSGPTKTERRRTVSFRRGTDPREELLRRSNTPDIKEVNNNEQLWIVSIELNNSFCLSHSIFQSITPFEPLDFPLSNDTVEQMIQCMPNSYKKIIDNCINLVTDDTVTPDNHQPITNHVKGSARPSPHSVECSLILTRFDDSDETESAVDEDPNDPEWRESSNNKTL